MKILAIESSAISASAAVLADGKIMGESYINTGLTHSQTLMTLIDSVLNNLNICIDDIDFLAVAAGPGSFTGIRIGVSTIKGLAFPKQKKCFSVSTLEALAYCVNMNDVLICPVMDARCQQVYTALFEKKGEHLTRLESDEPLKLDELAARLSVYGKKVVLIGDGAKISYDFLSKKDINVEKFSEIFVFQHASGVAIAAYNMYNNGEKPVDGEELLPVYLRLSQAERELKNRSEKNDCIK